MAINSWDSIISQIIRWQRKEFPSVTANSSARHLMQECGELLHAPNDLEEWADAFFIVLQGADRVISSPAMQAGLVRDLPVGEVLLLAVQAKFEKNKARTWKLPDEKTGVINHASEGRCAYCTNGCGWIESDAAPGTYYPCSTCNVDKRKPLTTFH
jgi:hypothetical protein